MTYSASDLSGNTRRQKVSVTIKDTTPPKLKTPDRFTVKKGGPAPNYRKNVSAKDKVDGKVSVSVNSSGVNLKKAGTYSVIYTAKDKAGNTVTKTVPVIVKKK